MFILKLEHNVQDRIEKKMLYTIHIKFSIFNYRVQLMLTQFHSHIRRKILQAGTVNSEHILHLTRVLFLKLPQ